MSIAVVQIDPAVNLCSAAICRWIQLSHSALTGCGCLHLPYGFGAGVFSKHCVRFCDFDMMAVNVIPGPFFPGTAFYSCSYDCVFQVWKLDEWVGKLAFGLTAECAMGHGG